MARSLWRTEDGWPYPDSGREAVEPDTDPDDDLLAVQAVERHLLDDLEPLEQKVLSARFGLFGTPVRSMRELHTDLGLPRGELRDALGSGLNKLRTQFRA